MAPGAGDVVAVEKIAAHIPDRELARLDRRKDADPDLATLDSVCLLAAPLGIAMLIVFLLAQIRHRIRIRFSARTQALIGQIGFRRSPRPSRAARSTTTTGRCDIATGST